MDGIIGDGDACRTRLFKTPRLCKGILDDRAAAFGLYRFALRRAQITRQLCGIKRYLRAVWQAAGGGKAQIYRNIHAGARAELALRPVGRVSALKGKLHLFDRTACPAQYFIGRVEIGYRLNARRGVYGDKIHRRRYFICKRYIVKVVDCGGYLKANLYIGISGGRRTLGV